jgi:phosphate:Na+ symporter
LRRAQRARSGQPFPDGKSSGRRLDMNPTLVLIDLAGAVALLLWGVRMVQTGVQRAFGSRLRTFLAAALRNRLTAFAAGLGATAVLQSSTATGLMLTGLAAGAAIDLIPALAVMLGANVGTTLIVQIVSFDVAHIAPALIAVGFLMFRRPATRTRDLGRVLIGLGLILLALQQLTAVTAPVDQAPTLHAIFTALTPDPLILMLIAAGLTWAAHSSVAMVLFIMSLAAGHVVTPQAAYVMVLGANLGTAINPVLEGAAGDDPSAKSIPFGNLLNRALGCALALFAIPYITIPEASPARAVADFHTAFNILLALIFLPLLTPYAALLRRLIPARTLHADPARPIYLDRAAIETPVVAIGAAAREALRLPDILESMLQGIRDSLHTDDRKRVAEIRHLDDRLDKLNASIKGYLTSLDPEAMTDADHRRVEQVLTFATNMEHAGDVIDKNLASHAAKRVKRCLTFSSEGQAEIAAMMDRLIVNLRTAAAVFASDDPRGARLLAGEKEVFRDMEAAATRAHFDRLRQGRRETAETSALHIDMLRDLKQLNAHLVQAAAYPLLETEGALLPTRLRSVA